MAEWTTDDLRTAALSNQKNVYVAAAAPGTAYDGQIWVCTSSDPPLVKVYDDTNTQWMQYHPVYYETQTGAWANPATTPITNGTLVVLYNSTQTGTRLYGYSNAGWVNLAGTLARVYPSQSSIQEDSLAPGANSISVGLYSPVRVMSGQAYTMASLFITPTNSGDIVTAYGGTGAIIGENSGLFYVRIYHGGNVTATSGVYDVNGNLGTLISGASQVYIRTAYTAVGVGGSFISDGTSTAVILVSETTSHPTSGLVRTAGGILGVVAVET